MKRSYKQFYVALDSIAPRKRVKKKFMKRAYTRRMFFGQAFKSKKAIVNFVKTFPQLEDGANNYKQLFEDYSKRNTGVYDMALVMWIGALKHDDYKMADKIRDYANGQGVTLSRFQGNIFMRNP